MDIEKPDRMTPSVERSLQLIPSVTYTARRNSCFSHLLNI